MNRLYPFRQTAFVPSPFHIDLAFPNVCIFYSWSLFCSASVLVSNFMECLRDVFLALLGLIAFRFRTLASITVTFCSSSLENRSYREFRLGLQRIHALEGSFYNFWMPLPRRRSLLMKFPAFTSGRRGLWVHPKQVIKHCRSVFETAQCLKAPDHGTQILSFIKCRLLSE
jgi:hypothetical protein